MGGRGGSAKGGGGGASGKPLANQGVPVYLRPTKAVAAPKPSPTQAEIDAELNDRYRFTFPNG